MNHIINNNYYQRITLIKTNYLYKGDNIERKNNNTTMHNSNNMCSYDMYNNNHNTTKHTTE